MKITGGSLEMNITGLFERRRLLKAAAVGGLSTLHGRAAMAEDDQQNIGSEARSDQVRMYEYRGEPEHEGHHLAPGT